MMITLKAVFPDFTEDEIKRASGEIIEKQYKLGEIIFKEGVERKELFIIKSGEVDIVKKIEDKEEHLIRCFKNDIVSEGGILDEAPHSTSCRAVIDTTLLIWNLQHIQRMVKDYPETASKVFKQIAIAAYKRLKGPSVGKVRKESDSLGEIDVPSSAYYGVQTERARKNFKITGIPLYHFPSIIKSMVMIKKAAALINYKLGHLKKDIAEAVSLACDEILKGDSYLLHQFIVDVIQGGAGTSTNMNANEVIANRAQEILGYNRGMISIEGQIKKPVHPNDHVNMSQSTNDVYPTAIRLAILMDYKKLTQAMNHLASEFQKKAEEFSDIIKMGRTQLQDAVPMTLEQEFEAFSVTIREDIDRIKEISEFLKEINIGGTAIGTGITADPKYCELVIKKLRSISNIHDLKKADHLVEATWDTGAFVLFFGMLKRIAVKLSKICNDLRLLSSGPCAGLGVINLPPVQPGSSIMPGKVNPVIPEVVNQVAFQVIGNDLAITMASEAGQLQLNVMEPLIAFNILQSIQMLTRVINILADHVSGGKNSRGITANKERCRKNVEESPGLATFLITKIGYDKAAEIAKKSLKTRLTVKEIVLSEKLMTEEELNDLLREERLTGLWETRRE
ncbi:aspartate ammonia-lyase [Candidatus Magnetomoraceae bacterium gMMP-1]